MNVAPPSEATFVSQPQQDNSYEPDLMITSVSADDEQTNLSLSLSSTSVLESVTDQSPESSTHMAVTENNATYLPSSSTQALQTCTPINIPSPPTLFIDSIILTDVCESIFTELNKLVNARNNFVHEEDYVKEWRRLRERVDFVMSELQKSCLEAHSNAKNSLHDWFKDVVKSMQEVEIKRTQERSKLYISDTPMFLDASGIISSCVHSENLDLKWLTKLKVQRDSPILEKLKSDSELEKENKKLKKDLLEHKLAFDEYKRQTEAQLEEARLREANLIRSNNEFKEEMKKQSETTYKMLKEMMDMFQKQAKP